MTQASLRAVTLKTVANYARAAERAVGAYRAGGRRLIAVVQRGVDQAATRGAQRIAPRLAAALRRASDRVGTLATQGVDAVSSGTERAIGFGSAGVTAQIERVAVLAGGVDYPVVVTSLQAVTKLSLPGAQAALALSERVVTGAEKLYGLSGARSTGVKKAGQRARRAMPKRAPAPAPVQAVVKRARATVKAVSEAVAPVVTKAAKPAPRKAAAPKAAKPAAPKKAAAKPQAAAPKATRARRAQPAKAAAQAAQAVQDAAAAVASAAA